MTKEILIEIIGNNFKPKDVGVCILNCISEKEQVYELANEILEAINYTRCSTQLKLVYTSDFCKWLETGFIYYDKTSDFLSKTGYRMTFKELVNKYEQDKKKNALIIHNK